MRKILFKDCLALARIMKKANVSEKLSEIAAEAKQQADNAEKDKDKTVNLERVGIKIALTIYENCGDEQAEAEIYKLLSSLFEEDAANMELDAIKLKFKQLAEENNIMAFFKSASQLIQ